MTDFVDIPPPVAAMIRNAPYQVLAMLGGHGDQKIIRDENGSPVIYYNNKTHELWTMTAVELVPVFSILRVKENRNLEQVQFVPDLKEVIGKTYLEAFESLKELSSNPEHFVKGNYHSVSYASGCASIEFDHGPMEVLPSGEIDECKQALDYVSGMFIVLNNPGRPQPKPNDAAQPPAPK